MSYRRLAITLWVATGLLFLAVTGLYYSGYRVTVTPSLPRGIYRQSPIDTSQLRRGQIVSFCPPDTQVFQAAKRRGYIPPGRCPGSYMPLFKPIAALPGDTVEVTANGIKVNGHLLKNSQIQLQDRQGRSMPSVPRGSYQVKPGLVWLVSSHHPQSFDSRYVGAVSRQSLIGALQPIWTE